MCSVATSRVLGIEILARTERPEFHATAAVHRTTLLPLKCRHPGFQWQEAAEAAARDLPGVNALQTATIMANGAMRCILDRRGWQVFPALGNAPGVF